jgi:hypothetical protein
MPVKLTFECVYDFIKSKGDTLISTEYINNLKLLEIQCGTCNVIYKQTYGRFYTGYKHAYCGIDFFKNLKGYKKPITLKPIECAICKKIFQPKRFDTKLCSMSCSIAFTRTPEYKLNAIENGKKGGQISATKQSRRSKNEVYFAELCKEYFTITTNEPYFDGWDADVIIHDHKIAILWNGAWHYKQISKTQQLTQVQARDRVKTAIINKYGYTPYIIKDMGKYDKQFVEEQFEIFLLLRMDPYSI